MSKVVGDIAVIVGADTSNLERNLSTAGRKVKGFGRDYETTAERMKRSAKGLAKALAASGVVAVGALGGLMVETMRTANELENLSRLAGVGVEDFQRMAFAAGKYGVEQEKLADILKDTNDKVGDFMQTGGGPLKDFFENIAPQVGLTAENFRKLSGPDALQAYVSALEKAGVSQSDMTFYMEALASDATLLVPLLADSGTEMERLGKKAEDLGIVLDEKMIGGTARMNEVWTNAMTKMKANFTKFASHVILGLDNVFGLTDIGQVNVLNRELDAVQKLVDRDADNVKRAEGLGNTALTGKAQEQFDKSQAQKDEIIGKIDAIAARAKKAREAMQRLHEPLDMDASSIGTSPRTSKAKAEQDELTSIEQDGWQARVAAVLQGGQQMAGAIGENNNKAAKAVKTFAAAEALINAYRAASQTLADPSLPFVAKFGAMAAVLSQGISLANSIKSVGASGGGGGAATSSSGAAGAAPSTYYNVSLPGEGMISGGSVRDLIGKINEEIENGAAIRGITVS